MSWDIALEHGELASQIAERIEDLVTAWEETQGARSVGAVGAPVVGEQLARHLLGALVACLRGDLGEMERVLEQWAEAEGTMGPLGHEVDRFMSWVEGS